MTNIRALALLSLTLFASCATETERSYNRVSAELTTKIGSGIRDAASQVAIPTGVDLSNGIDENEAVALALWNNPAFRASLADLGIAEADLTSARTPANPTLSLLDPVGSGVLEGAIAIPVNLLRRPARIEAASQRREQAIQSLVHSGLGLARDVRTRLADLAFAHQRADLLAADAEAAKQLADLAKGNQDVGRGTGLETATALAASADARLAARRAENEVRLSRLSLEQLTVTPVGEIEFSEVAPGPLPDLEILRQRAFASRPDLLAAEMAVGASARDLDRLGLDVLQPGVIVDLGQENGEGLKVSGGASINIPVFDQGQAARSRAQAGYERAVAERDGVRLMIDQQISAAITNLDTAQVLLAVIDNELLPEAERRVAVSQASFQLGRAPILDAVLARRDLVSARLQRADAEAALRRARAELSFGVGSDVFVSNEEGNFE